MTTPNVPVIRKLYRVRAYNSQNQMVANINVLAKNHQHAENAVKAYYSKVWSFPEQLKWEVKFLGDDALVAI